VTERELARGAARRLAIIRHVQEVTGNVALTCRCYGITRQCYYVWFRRYEEFGVEGLRDRSSRPHVSPKTTREEVVGKIISLRQNYHFGPHKIAMYLERDHEIKVSPSGIWRILKRLDMSRLPASQRLQGALAAPQGALAALREAPAWASGPSGREVRGADRGHAQEALPVHRDR